MIFNPEAVFTVQYQLNFLMNGIYKLGKYEFKEIKLGIIFQKSFIEGKVYKAIENVNILHFEKHHYRSLVLDIGKRAMMTLLHSPFT